MEQSKSGNLTIADVITFVALLILGLAVFFGMNFATLGNKIPSAVVAVLLFMLMVVFVYLAAYAKRQDRNQGTWHIVEYVMLGLYVVALVPCYIYSAKFFEIQLDKRSIMRVVQSDIDGINEMFANYNKECEARSANYQTELEAMIRSREGRQRIVAMLDMDKNPESLSMGDVDRAVESFEDYLFKSTDISALKAEKNELLKNCETNFKNWNILFLPQYVEELGGARARYAESLTEIFAEHTSPLEKEAPVFEVGDIAGGSNIVDAFTGSTGFSVLGLVGIILLGGLGVIKYALGPRSNVIPLKKGEKNSIEQDGGYSF